MAAEKRAMMLDWAATAAKTLLPIVAIGWYANQAIENIRKEAATAVAQVAASVADIRLAQAVHEKMDDQRQSFTDARLDRVERRQDSVESALGRLGVQSLNNRRPNGRLE